MSFSSPARTRIRSEPPRNQCRGIAKRINHEIQREGQANNETRGKENRRPRPEPRESEPAVGIKSDECARNNGGRFLTRRKEAWAHGGGGGGGGTGREGTARGFASTGSGQRRVRPCSGTVQRGNGSGGYSQLAAQPVGPAPHHLTAPRGEEESGERERLSRTAASMGVAMCSVGRTARKRAGLGGD